MGAEVYVAVVALVVSVIASGVAVVQTRRTEYLSRMPILVLIYNGSIERWIAHNVGYGPALNIVVAQQYEDDSGRWYNPVLIPALAVGETFTLEWLGDTGDYSLGARYSDLLDRRQSAGHFAYTRYDRCSVYPSGRVPRWIMPLYAVNQVRRHWEEDLPWRPPGE